jgi:hypothetical protein
MKESPDPYSDDRRADPFDVPRSFSSEKVPLLDQALRLLGLVEEGSRPLLATPSSRQNHVIGAKEGGPCCKCGQKVWLSPSAQRNAQAFTSIVCLECCEKAVGLTEEVLRKAIRKQFRATATEAFITAMLKKLGYL